MMLALRQEKWGDSTRLVDVVSGMAEEEQVAMVGGALGVGWIG